MTYAPTTVEDVSILVNRFDGQISRYIFCSTTAVYSLVTSRPEIAQRLIAAKALEGTSGAAVSTPTVNPDWTSLLNDLEPVTTKLNQIFLR